MLFSQYIAWIVFVGAPIMMVLSAYFVEKSMMARFHRQMGLPAYSMRKWLFAITVWIVAGIYLFG